MKSNFLKLVRIKISCLIAASPPNYHSPFLALTTDHLIECEFEVMSRERAPSLSLSFALPGHCNGYVNPVSMLRVAKQHGGCCVENQINAVHSVTLWSVCQEDNT